jgi:hypothetical protein
MVVPFAWCDQLHRYDVGRCRTGLREEGSSTSLAANCALPFARGSPQSSPTESQGPSWRRPCRVQHAAFAILVIVSPLAMFFSLPLGWPTITRLFSGTAPNKDPDKFPSQPTRSN